MAFIVLIGFGLAASLFTSHFVFWLLEQRRTEKKPPDLRFTRDQKYARLFHPRAA